MGHINLQVKILYGFNTELPLQYMFDNMKSEVHIIKSLVEYQEGTIVSKAIISNQSGSVTLFAFDKDQTLSEHTASFDAMLQVLDGNVQVTISGETFELESGETIIMPANEPHAVKATTRFKMMLVMIKG